MATSTVEGFERVINRHLRRWIGVPSSFNIIGLYGRTNQLKLQMTSIVEEFKERKTGCNPETVNRWPDKEGGPRDTQEESGQQAKKSPRPKAGYDTKASQEIPLQGAKVLATQNYNTGSLPGIKIGARW